MKYLILSAFIALGATAAAAATLCDASTEGPRIGGPLAVTVTVDDVPLTVRVEGECSRMKQGTPNDRYELDVCRESRGLLSVNLTAQRHSASDHRDLSMQARLRPTGGETVVLGATHVAKVTMKTD
ncbi:MAG: hypothetical protein RIT81_09330 [Deltaproteobacteria bacterium]